jgi:hypothetical protein
VAALLDMAALLTSERVRGLDSRIELTTIGDR